MSPSGSTWGPTRDERRWRGSTATAACSSSLTRGRRDRGLRRDAAAPAERARPGDASGRDHGAFGHPERGAMRRVRTEGLGRAIRGAAALCLCALWIDACASKAPPPVAPGAPHYPDFTFPSDAGSPGDVRLKARHEAAWRSLQAGDTRTAAREFGDILRRTPAFYPAQAGLGYALVAEGRSKDALPHFDRVLQRLARLRAGPGRTRRSADCHGADGSGHREFRGGARRRSRAWSTWPASRRPAFRPCQRTGGRRHAGRRGRPSRRRAAGVRTGHRRVSRQRVPAP